MELEISFTYFALNLLLDLCLLDVQLQLGLHLLFADLNFLPQFVEQLVLKLSWTQI